MVAVRERQASVAELLLTEGQADPNLGRSKGYYKSQIETPLSMAIIKRMCHLVALFLAKGASPDEHAIAAALEWGGIAEVLRQLLEAGGHPPPSAIITAVDSALRDEIEVARILIDRERLDVNYVADQNSEFAGEGTALNAAVMRGKVKTVGLLLERGADANLAAGKYGTPLQRAARLGLYDFVPLLVAGGGDPNYVDDKYPCCPLYTAYEQLLQRRSKYLDHGDQERFMFLVDDVEVRLRLTIRELKKAGATLLRPQFEDAGNEVDFSAFLAVQQRYESELPIIDGSLNQASPIQYDSDLWSLPTRGTTGSQE
ncbi:hypothetical protein NKR23_g981 [Pleurostoma richardsiae]|uniref:Ankyrin n=1 Tax=Pleurostoma richardsiae TaxID=41990 RepID=A0AA38VK21_9PEZI|nr:hypothetical protein NKR23_g981 [Pleurostoma richardsiae]